jgi:hypothetical protein
MGMYTGVRFQAQVTEEAREIISWCQEDRQSRGWHEAAEKFDVPWLTDWVRVGRCNFIPWGYLCYLGGWAGEEEQYSRLEGASWEVLCSLKNYQGEIRTFCEEILPHMITAETIVESRYEESPSSVFYSVSPKGG